MSIHARGRRALVALLAVLLLCTGCQRTAKTPAAAPVQEAVPAAEDLSAAVVYGPGDRWRDTLAALENSTLADLTAAALPAEDEGIRAWQAANPLRRPVQVRVSDRVASPLT